MVTLKDIAKKANVSISTVSRTLNYDKSLNITNATRKKIFAVANELNYKSKKHKKKKSVFTIGILSEYTLEEELEDLYYLTIHINIEKKLRATKHSFSPIAQKDGLYDFTEIDGIISIGVLDDHTMDQLENSYKPVVFIDNSPDPLLYDSVVFDLYDSSYKALDFLYNTGHRAIAFIGGENFSNSSRQQVINKRLDAYKDFTRNMDISNEDYLKIGSYTPEFGYRAFKELMELSHRPNSIFAANDTLAIGAYKAADELGIKIPCDVSIIGCNDIPIAKYMVPPLSTIKLHTDFISQQAIDLLIDRLQTNREICKKLVIPSKLLLRESTL